MLGSDTRLEILRRLRRLAEIPRGSLAGEIGTLYAVDAVWRGSTPLDEMAGSEAVLKKVWLPLLAAFPDLERRDLIFVGGEDRGHALVAAMGHYCGTFAGDYLGIPATGKVAMLRFGEVHELQGGRIVRSTCLWDLLDLMRQAGVWPLAPSLGVEGPWPGPLTGDGLVLHDTSPAESAASLAQTLAMHQTLLGYDDFAGRGRQGLLDMPQKQHWHPRMMWYGPAGIGTTRGLAGFVDHHQVPFRTAFPLGRPEAAVSRPGEHMIRLGDGCYSVTGGWPSRRLMHLGGGWLGMPATGKEISMRVMDFYLHHEGLIRENWVPIDIIHVLQQMGLDVFARMREMLGRR